MNRVFWALRTGGLRLLSWLALPFVLLAMVVVPFFGGHFCIQEALPVLSLAAALPFIGPAIARRLRLKRQAKVHCCDEQHTKFKVSPTVVSGRIVLQARKVDVDDQPECDDAWCATEYPHRKKDHTS